MSMLLLLSIACFIAFKTSSALVNGLQSEPDSGSLQSRRDGTPSYNMGILMLILDALLFSDVMLNDGSGGSSRRYLFKNPPCSCFINLSKIAFGFSEAENHKKLFVQ